MTLHAGEPRFLTQYDGGLIIRLMASQVPQSECQVPNAERGTADTAEWRASSFGLPPEVALPIADAAREAGVEVYHAAMSGRELRVQVECESGTSVRNCSDFSRALSSRLDAVNFLHRQYTLEVSSPGIERRLYRPEDYAKALNQHVRVLTRTGWVEGLLVAAAPTGITLRNDCKVKDARCKIQDGGHKEATADTTSTSTFTSTSVCFADIRDAQIRVSETELFARATHNA